MVAVWGRIPNGQGREVLQKKLPLIAKTFNEAGHQNLRLLLRAMRDTAAMLDALTPEMLEFDSALNDLTSTFLALHMAYHGGRLSKQDMLSRSKYRSLSASRTENDKTVFDALRKVQEDHPECSIDSMNGQILPVDLGYALVVDGYQSSSLIVEGLLSTHQFSTPSENPDWMRLWKWTDEPVEDLDGVIQRLKDKLKNLEIVQPGEVLQLYAASKFVASQNGIEFSETEVAGFFKKYIRLLAKHDKIPARIPSSTRDGRRYGYRDEGGTCSYYGYAFNVGKSDRRIIDLMQVEQDDALAKLMPEYATQLMDDLANDFSAFKDRFEYTSPDANFSETPVFQYMGIDEAAEVLLKIFAENREQAQALLEILEKRRSKHCKEFKEEWSWIDSFKETSIRKAYGHSKLFGAQIAQYFKWFLKAG